jgi:hypothetical protein
VYKRQVLLCAVLLTAPLFAEEKEKEKKIEVKLKGFVGVSAFYDSRQSVAPRNGHIYLYPLPVNEDANGKDINASGRYDIDPSHTRFGLHISGPDILGATSFALIETDFLGASGGNDLNLRLRHAMVRLNWEKSYLLMGQYWHPMFVTECFPSQVGLDPGLPFTPFARSPQVRYGFDMAKNLELNLALVAQNTFKNAGMTWADEWSQVPELDVQLKYKTKSFLAALTFGAKSLKPQLSERIPTDENPNNDVILKTDETVDSYHINAVVKKTFDKAVLKGGYTYGGNMSNMVMLGGVGRISSEGELSEYMATYSSTYWADIQGTGKVQPGLFFGYSKANGAKDDIEVLAQYSLGMSTKIGTLYSLSPRVTFVLAPQTTLGIQYAVTVAGYGDSFDEKGVPQNLDNATNHRTTLSLKYAF